ncbi:eukaryotic translation initiation factor 3 subunit H [Ditylenchus destructor]|nr:eukaryotic translation initiation factor 3 subunit H [Ditylenchus destructor]
MYTESNDDVFSGEQVLSSASTTMEVFEYDPLSTEEILSRAPVMARNGGGDAANVSQLRMSVRNMGDLLNHASSELDHCQKKCESLEHEKQVLILEKARKMATIVPLATIPLADPKVDKVQIDSSQTENEVRIKNGESPLPLDDLKKIYKYPQLQTKTGMLEIFLNARSTEAYADYATQITGQNIAKLFVSETISGVGDSTDKERTTSTSRA